MRRVDTLWYFFELGFLGWFYLWRLYLRRLYLWRIVSVEKCICGEMYLWRIVSVVWCISISAKYKIEILVLISGSLDFSKNMKFVSVELYAENQVPRSSGSVYFNCTAGGGGFPKQLFLQKLGTISIHQLRSLFSNRIGVWHKLTNSLFSFLFFFHYLPWL